MELQENVHVFTDSPSYGLHLSGGLPELLAWHVAPSRAEGIEFESLVAPRDDGTRAVSQFFQVAVVVVPTIRVDLTFEPTLPPTRL